MESKIKMTADEWFKMFYEFIEENDFNVYNDHFRIAKHISDIITTTEDCSSTELEELLNYRAYDIFQDLLRFHAIEIARRFSISKSKENEREN